MVELLLQGYSFGLVARLMAERGFFGITRSTIAGRKHRMGIKLTAVTRITRRAGEPRPSLPAKPRTLPHHRDVPLPKLTRPVEGVEYLEMQHWHCRAILPARGGPYNLPMVCGARRVRIDGTLQSYCSKHLIEYTHASKRIETYGQIRKATDR